MSGKRRSNVVFEEYMGEVSSDEEQSDARNQDSDVTSSGRLASGRQENMASNGPGESRRRGRGVSKRPCLNRNAQMARENRQRKKEYLEKVENKLAFYRQENKSLANVIQRQGIDLKRLKAEVSYLKNVLNNSSSITALLKTMNDTLSGKKSNKEGGCSEKKLLRARNDSENSSFMGKHEESSTRYWKDTDRAPWRSGGKYVDRSAARKSPYDAPLGIPKASSIADSDHTYTTSRDGSFDENFKNSDELDAPCDKVTGAFSQINSDRFIGDFGSSVLNLGIDEDLDELPQFDVDLFDSVGNEVQPEAGLQYFSNDGLTSASGNLFESLDNSGICLHVNSGRISLEFCSICHLNSINSSE